MEEEKKIAQPENHEPVREIKRRVYDSSRFYPDEDEVLEFIVEKHFPD